MEVEEYWLGERPGVIGDRAIGDMAGDRDWARNKDRAIGDEKEIAVTTE